MAKKVLLYLTDKRMALLGEKPQEKVYELIDALEWDGVPQEAWGKDAKTVIVSVRVTQEEAAAIKDMAARAGVTVSELIRRALFPDKSHPPLPSVPQEQKPARSPSGAVAKRQDKWQCHECKWWQLGGVFCPKCEAPRKGAPAA